MEFRGNVDCIKYIFESMNQCKCNEIEWGLGERQGNCFVADLV